MKETQKKIETKEEVNILKNTNELLITFHENEDINKLLRIYNKNQDFENLFKVCSNEELLPIRSKFKSNLIIFKLKIYGYFLNKNKNYLKILEEIKKITGINYEINKWSVSFYIKEGELYFTYDMFIGKNINEIKLFLLKKLQYNIIYKYLENEF